MSSYVCGRLYKRVIKNNFNAEEKVKRKDHVLSLAVGRLFEMLIPLPSA